jgi:MFS family permease
VTTSAKINLSFPEILVAVPVSHVVISSLFLMGYYAAFGGGIANFGGPSDIFAVSIQDIGPSYITTIAMPLFVLVWTRAKLGAWTPHEANLLLPKDQHDEAELKRASLKRYFMRIGIFLIVILIVNLVYERIRFNRFNFSIIWLLSLIILGLVLVWFDRKLHFDNKIYFSSWIIGCVLITAPLSGLNRGQRDRNASFAEISQNGALCGSAAIIRPLSSLYLAVTRDDKKVILDGDCRIKFLLP